MAYGEEKKGKVMKIFENYAVFTLFESYEFCTIKRDALRESMKCKSLKSISKPKILEKSDISGFLTGFQKAFPDMSSPQPRHI
jgi:hypothetical protein